MATITPADYTSCGTPCMLCGMGSVAADVNFGGLAMIGFNLNQAADSSTVGTVTPTGTSLVVNFTNANNAPLRISIIGATGDTVATDRWCVSVTAATSGPITIPYTSFNTQCWAGGTGVAYARQPIKAVQIHVPGNNVASIPFNVCLTSVTDS
jgi:hypothetical protein